MYLCINYWNIHIIIRHYFPFLIYFFGKEVAYKLAHLIGLSLPLISSLQKSKFKNNGFQKRPTWNLYLQNLLDPNSRFKAKRISIRPQWISTPNLMLLRMLTLQINWKLLWRLLIKLKETILKYWTTSASSTIRVISYIFLFIFSWKRNILSVCSRTRKQHCWSNRNYFESIKVVTRMTSSI